MSEDQCANPECKTPEAKMGSRNLCKVCYYQLWEKNDLKRFPTKRELERLEQRRKRVSGELGPNPNGCLHPECVSAPDAKLNNRGLCNACTSRARNDSTLDHYPTKAHQEWLKLPFKKREAELIGSVLKMDDQQIRQAFFDGPLWDLMELDRKGEVIWYEATGIVPSWWRDPE